MHDPDRDAARDDQGEGHHPVHIAVHDQVDEQHAEQRDHRPHGQLDAADDDHESLRDREDAEHPDLVGGVGKVADQEKARIDDRHDRADHQDQDEQAEIFLVHGRLVQTVWPTASCSTLCSLNSLRARKPEMRPSCITAIRSLTPITSSMSLEIIRIATPASESRRSMS